MFLESYITGLFALLLQMMSKSLRKEQTNKCKKGRGKQIMPSEEFEDELELNRLDMTVAETEFQMVDS